jgi:IS30 family transposase
VRSTASRSTCRGATPRADCLLALRSGDAQTAAAGRSTPDHDQGHGHDLRAAGGGHRPAVPGHWEGDLITGATNSSTIGTLVERTTRFTLLLHLPQDHGASAVCDAIASTITTLPLELRRSLTWDQGSEMAQHLKLTVEAGLPVHFCDPRSPWQRGSNENTVSACCVSTSPRAPISPSTLLTTSLASPLASTADHGRHSAGRHQPRR